MNDEAPGWSFGRELKTLITFGGPIILAQFGFLLFGIVDTWMVGKIGKGAVGGVGAASSIYWFLAMMGSGIFYSLDTLASQARGRGDEEAQQTILFQGLLMATALSAAFIVVLYPVSLHFSSLGIRPELLVYADPYFALVFWSGPLFFYFVVLQRYWQARGRTMAILGIVLAANGVNYFANRALIFGEFGAPAMGIEGAAVATLLARSTLMGLAGGMTLVALLKEEAPGQILARFQPHRETLSAMLRLGTPVAMMLAFEYGVFSLATQLAVRVDAASADAHQVGVVLISVLYMLPVGLSSTAAYRVGFLIGQEDPEGARKVGHFYVAVAAATMALAGVGLMAGAASVYRFFVVDPEVIALGVRVAWWVAVLLVFDATQVTAAGCLRGFGSTKAPAVANFVGYYLVGLPLAVWLCFRGGYGVEGLWMGLTAGIVAVSAIVGTAWLRATPPKKTEEIP